MSEMKFDFSYDPYGNVIDMHTYVTELVDIPISEAEFTEFIYFEALARGITEQTS